MPEHTQAPSLLPVQRVAFSPRDMHWQACTQPDTRLTADLSARNDPSLTWKYRVRACALRRVHLSTSPWSLRYITDLCYKNKTKSEVSQPCHLPTKGSICPEHRVPMHFSLNWSPQDKEDKNLTHGCMNTKIARKKRAVENKMFYFGCSWHYNHKKVRYFKIKTIWCGKAGV